MSNIFAQIKPNKPTTTLEGYFVSLYGKSKVGKTTFIYELIEKHYQGDFSKAIILATEIGYKTLNGVHAMDITGYESPAFEAENEEDQYLYGFGFIQAIDKLIEYKHVNPYRLVIIDTLTALQRYASQYVVEEASIRDDKDYATVGDILWGVGYNLLQEAVYEQIDRLKKAGFGVLTISHDKTRTVEPKIGAKWDFTTLNLESKVADIVVREADINMYADLKVKANAKGEVVTTRELVLRSDGAIECGSRFANMPEKIDFSASAFLETFEKAVLSLYDGDQSAVASQTKAEESDNEMKRQVVESATEEESATPAIDLDTLKADIRGLQDQYQEAGKLGDFKTILKDGLGILNYMKSDDAQALQETITALSNELEA